MATNAGNKPSTSKFSIVRAISAFLKLGEDGKLDSFFNRVVKTLSKEVAAHEANLKTMAFNHEQKMDELNDQYEDATSALEEAYLKVDMQKIGTNEDQKSFQEIYLSNIDSHEKAVKKVENEIKAAKERYEERVKDVKDQIASLQTRIKKISAE